ncbi:MAG: hypothetical protein AMJ62_01565 [Myxococcales bacterium SG8_38]|nr:MAG: hypothetical protein AMJ62_01565 [Myxococcales bacterium SG8_38]
MFEGLTGQKVLDIAAAMTPEMAEDALQDPVVDPDPMVDPTMDPDGGIGGMGGFGGAGGAGGAGGVAGMGGAGGAGGTDETPPPPPPPLPDEEPQIDPDVDPALERAYNLQQQILRTIQRRFIDSGYNFKLLVREIVLTPYFRAKNAAPLTSEMEIELSTFGTARLLTPEHLSRKIEATTGVRWRRRPDQEDYLLRQYRIFYGGIDSDLVTKRVTEPNGVMASLAQRMAYEVACSAVPYDFSKPANQRLLFPYIDRDTPLSEASSQVRDNVRHLHARISGEELSSDDPEIDATVGVLMEAYSLGREGLASGTVSEELAEPCRLFNDRNTGESLPDGRRIGRDQDYTLRAWMAAVSYLLSDYQFLYE